MSQQHWEPPGSPGGRTPAPSAWVPLRAPLLWIRAGMHSAMLASSWADTTVAATCPICRGRIVAIHRLQGQVDHNGAARHHHGRLHPQVELWRWQGRWQRRQQRGPGGPRRRRLSDDRGERRPPVPRQRVRSMSSPQDRDRSPLHRLPDISEDLQWLRRSLEDEPGSGDHVRRLPLPCYRVRRPGPPGPSRSRNTGDAERGHTWFLLCLVALCCTSRGVRGVWPWELGKRLAYGSRTGREGGMCVSELGERGHYWLLLCCFAHCCGDGMHPQKGKGEWSALGLLPADPQRGQCLLS